MSQASQTRLVNTPNPPLVYVGLKFMLESGFFICVVDEPFAKHVKENYLAGKLPKILAYEASAAIQKRFSFATGLAWQINIERILGIDYFDPFAAEASLQAQQQGQPPPQGGFKYDASGLRI